MEFIPLYADRKAGTVPIEYDHPLLEPILKETYGIMVYQEQVMQAAQILAGYTLGGADVLRRAMGKKKPEEMAKQRAIFVEGCAKKNNIKRREGQPAFRRARQVRRLRFQQGARRLLRRLTCQTAWLKARYPVAVHGRAALQRARQHRQDRALRGRGEGDGHQGPAARA